MSPEYRMKILGAVEQLSMSRGERSVAEEDVQPPDRLQAVMEYAAANAS